MSNQEDIDKAIAAHGMWKQRLIIAITSGTSEFSVSNVEVDNKCAFGQWFYGLPKETQESTQGKKIQDLHAKFHKEAAKILGIALDGKKEEAEKLIEQGSQYSTISGQLAISLSQWKTTIDKT